MHALISRDKYISLSAACEYTKHDDEIISITEHNLWTLKSWACHFSRHLADLKSSAKDDIVDGNEHELDDVADEADHDEAHCASLQNFHVFY